MRKKGKQVKLPKKFWEKGKSKFLKFRPELQNKLNLDISDEWREKEAESIKANRKRRLEKYGHA